MIAHVTANEVLRKVGVSTKSKKVTPEAKRIRTAAPRYMSEAQATALRIAGEQGWTARSIVADAKAKRCAVSIEKDGEVAWIASDGSVKSESDIVKSAGAV